MNKSKQKRNKYNQIAVNNTAKVFGFSARYIRACLKGDRKGIMADNVIKQYKTFVSEINKSVENIVNK
ncbi:hypothetical protein [Riemerella anatipestifer]|uniref:hypothetical protein n=1 Tax=Riemerella anatipestifer TaxID=34085 RepID=UPI0021B09F7C|nr:hypothetical protein [Riemerella anatipestifer]MCT6765632.1 hypothetical protein [Riemerella anatipestifer]MCT6769811.1 hypothetical protein [Riemerella anatipestifer]MCU7594381.1 hypothetical protein [Riemerella anatipestifer]MCU7602513.1 hypothetical protein [Riemerella anatipestifer]MCU7610652.1 hypothetical protein [Riemerella anatipestifer]